MTLLGILSDTHLVTPDHDFRKRVELAFADCQVIIHAGDITDLSVLSCFGNRRVYAVHGNMCNARTRVELPEHRIISIDQYTIGLSHGTGSRFDIEDRMATLFPDADCIIYGHTHIPVCHRRGETLIINPGSFQATGRHGAQGSYAVVELRPDTLCARLHTLDNYT